MNNVKYIYLFILQLFDITRGVTNGPFSQQTFCISRKSTGVINTINSGSAPSKCMHRPCQEANMQNSPALEQAELSGVQPLLNLLITPVAFTSLTRVRDEKA